jgi:hypothetical protein
MAVHPSAVEVAQDRTAVTIVDRMVEGAGHGWRQRDEDYLAALTTDP